MLKEKLIPMPDTGEDGVFNSEPESINLEEFITQVFSDIETSNSAERLTRYKKWQKMRAFYRGNQRGFWDAKKNTWVNIDIDSLSPSEQSVLVINNQFRPQIKTLAKEFSRSQTRIRTNSMSDSQRSVLASRFADALVKFYQHKLMPESARQLEAKYIFLCGNSFRYTYYDPDKKSAKVKVKKTSKAVLPAYESTVCPECGDDGQGDKCSRCGGVMETTSVSQSEGQSVRYETMNTGDFETEIVDPVEIEVWSGARDIDTSPYLKRRRIVRKEFLLRMFPFYSPSEKNLSDSAAQQAQFSDTSTNTTKTQSVYEYEQLWLDPEMYQGKVLEKPVKFKKNVENKWVDTTLDKGTKISDEFPDGLYVCRVGKDILGYYSESKNMCWVHIPFDVNVDGFWADGLEDAMMNQQIINEYTSISVENVLYNASPKLVINPALINPVTVTGRPKDMLLLNNNASKDSAPRDAFAQISGMSLTSEVITGIEMSKRDMREQTGALIAFNGQGDPTLTTATAMSIARDSALALVSTPLSIRAEKDQEWLWQVLRYVKDYWYDQKYKFLLGKYNESEADAFKESDLDEELNVYAESNSWMPQTNYERLQNLGAYLTAFGIPLGFLNPQIPQPVREYASQLYNIPFEFNELAPDTRIAQKRLDMAKDVAEIQLPKIARIIPVLQAESRQEDALDLAIGTRTIIANSMGVEEDIDDHAVFITEYTKWLKTDEGQNAHPILREAVKQTLADHQAFLSTQSGEMAAQAGMVGALSGQPPASPLPEHAFESQPNGESPFSPVGQTEIKDFSKNR